MDTDKLYGLEAELGGLIEWAAEVGLERVSELQFAALLVARNVVWDLYKREINRDSPQAGPSVG